MRISLMILILFSCLLLSGCSYSTLFAVVNNSDSSIEVEFSIVSNFDSLEHTATKPYKTSLSEWNKWLGETEWQEIPQQEWNFDSQNHTAKIILNSNEVLRIAVDLHSEIILPTENYEFPIKNLRLNGKNGDVIYSGKKIFNQFEKKDDHNYFIKYR